MYVCQFIFFWKIPKENTISINNRVVTSLIMIIDNLLIDQLTLITYKKLTNNRLGLHTNGDGYMSVISV